MHKVRFKQDNLLNHSGWGWYFDGSFASSELKVLLPSEDAAMINLRGWHNSDLLRFGRVIHTGVVYLKPIDGINGNGKLPNALTGLKLCSEKIGSEIRDGDFKILGIPQGLFLSKRATSQAGHREEKKIATSDSSQGSCSSDDQGNEIQRETDEQDLPKEPESEPRKGIFVPEWVFNDISSSAMAISEIGLSEVMQKTLKELDNPQTKRPEVLYEKLLTPGLVAVKEVLDEQYTTQISAMNTKYMRMEDMLVRRLETASKENPILNTQYSGIKYEPEKKLETAHEESFALNTEIVKIADEFEERFETYRKEKEKEKRSSHFGDSLQWEPHQSNTTRGKMHLDNPSLSQRIEDITKEKK
ncbi:hypothetical protein BCON_0024g00700 [Botryotinia convoluta]|uniref:Uncharacterized protein n=1 Tax=Botryotinia convoluta TaxID=54673 RepID=A0A4Z1IKE2_9HELO|nr:hypothetical protein BCON_0024g00700 [Botryotinia convoluta]